MIRRALLLTLLSLVAVSCHWKGKGSPTQPVVDVTAYTIEEKKIPLVFDFLGFAESTHPVEIRARVQGYLDKIAYQEGQLVKEGDLLFQLDPKGYEAKVELAKAEVSKQEALLENARLTVNRLTPLFEQKAASKKDLDNAIANQLATQASLQAAQAQLLDAQINLGYTTIVTPITGLADKSKLREGALINPGDNSLITTVSVLDPIWVYWTISDNDILRIRQLEESKSITLPTTGKSSITLPQDNGYEVKVVMSDGSLYPHMGKVDFYSPTYDQTMGTLLVRGIFPNPDAVLRPGQFVRIKVYGAERPHAIVVPRRALIQKKNGVFVYLINEKDEVVAQDISTSDWVGDFQIVTNGLKPGDKIVVDGINKLHPGTPVRVIDTWVPEDKKEIETGPA